MQSPESGLESSEEDDEFEEAIIYKIGTYLDTAPCVMRREHNSFNRFVIISLIYKPRQKHFTNTYYALLITLYGKNTRKMHLY